MSSIFHYAVLTKAVSKNCYRNTLHLFEDNFCHLNVTRRHVWQDTKRSFLKPYTNIESPLKITFIGEPSADEADQSESISGYVSQLH